MISFEFYLKKWQEKTQKPLWFLGFLEPISFSVHNFGCGGRTRTYGLVFSLRRKYCGRFGGSDSPPDCHSLPPHPSSYSPFGLITRTGSWKNNLHNLKKRNGHHLVSVFVLASCTDLDILLFYIINIILHDFHLILFHSIQDIYKAIFSVSVW